MGENLTDILHQFIELVVAYILVYIDRLLFNVMSNAIFK